MAYSSFTTTVHPTEVRPSPLESAAAHHRVGRLEWGEAVRAEDVRPRELIANAGFDVVVTRYPSGQLGVAESLSRHPLRSIFADTLLYFGMSTLGVDLKDPERVRLLTPSDSDRVAVSALTIFAGYPNHHAASSIFGDIDVAAAYADWAVRSLAEPDTAVFARVDEDGIDVGLCVLDLSQTDVGEVALAGIQPAARRQGHYLELLAAAREMCARRGKQQMVISTQSNNIAALAAWTQMGMRPLTSLTTLHVTDEGSS